MSLKYKVLFRAEFVHDYYTDLKCSDFSIVPTPDTKAALSGNGLLYKVMDNLLIVLIRVDDANKPLNTINPEQKFSFYLKVENSYFQNFTNLSYKPADIKRYYLSNLTGNKITTSLYLTAKIPAYSNSSDYPVTSFAANGANDVFEAAKPSSNADQHGLNDAIFWSKKGKSQYLSNDDLIEITPFVYVFKATPAKNFTIKVFKLNTAGSAYDAQVLDDVLLNFTQNQIEVPVGLEQLAAGKYRIEVNGESQFVYYDGSVTYNHIFGVLEIVNNLPAADAFSLFDSQGRPKSPRFTVRFASRSVIWKYISRTADVTGIKDSTNAVSFTPAAGNQFLSDKPFPVSEKPISTLFLESTSLGTVSPISNPPKERITIIEKDGETYYCGELNLNY